MTALYYLCIHLGRYVHSFHIDNLFSAALKQGMPRR